MLRRKEGASLRRKPSREEYGEVVAVVGSSYPNSEAETRALGKLESGMRKLMERAVEAFLHSAENEDLAKFNDVMLRAFLKLPERVRQTSQGSVFYAKMVRTAREIVAAKRVAINAIDDPLGARLCEDASMEIGKNLDSLESSVFQIARFLLRQSRAHPDRVFATGINIDVRYGIDLVGVDSRFDEEEERLLIDLFLYQAKASRVGLSAQDVRGLPTRYANKKLAAKEELELDADWVRRELLGRNPEPSLELEDERALDILIGTYGSLRILSREYSMRQNLKPADRFRVSSLMYSQLGILANKLGVEMPAHIAKPRIDIGEVEFRYLVDTVRGTEDLSEDEAREYSGQRFLSGSSRLNPTQPNA